MGMFSWCCKGCNKELIEGEVVRINGHQGLYDGYGRAGDFDYGESSYLDGDNWDHGSPTKEPVCWHEACYQAASPEKQKDKTGSKNAPNQGFGAPDPRFMPNMKSVPHEALGCSEIIRPPSEEFEEHPLR